jgi:L-threonylcarbamoyladenylate synthase
VKTIPFVSARDIEAGAHTAAGHLRADGLLAYPTETVYGFGCALSEAALTRLATLKRRDAAKPFLILVPAWPPAGVIWTPVADQLAHAFWPGPLTLVLAAASDAFPAAVCDDHGRVAVRATPHAGMRRVLELLGAPITSTSANAPGKAPARDAHEAEAAFDALGVLDGLVLDGGRLPASASSTIVDASGARPRIMRQGAIGTDAVTQGFGGVDVA